MQRLVALTQGLLVGRAGRLGGGCSLVADRPNACWEAWGLVRELTGQSQNAEMVGAEGIPGRGRGSG